MKRTLGFIHSLGPLLEPPRTERLLNQTTDGQVSSTSWCTFRGHKEMDIRVWLPSLDTIHVLRRLLNFIVSRQILWQPDGYECVLSQIVTACHLSIPIIGILWQNNPIYHAWHFHWTHMAVLPPSGDSRNCTVHPSVFSWKGRLNKARGHHRASSICSGVSGAPSRSACVSVWSNEHL